MLNVLLRDDEVRALAAEWAALWRGSAAAPMQSPAWAMAWWDAFGTGRPVVATLRDPAGALLGVLPLYLLDEGAARKLLPIGVGASDYFDALLAPHAPAGAAGALLGATLAAAAQAGATECALPDLPPDAALLAVPLPAGWDGTARPGAPCPVLRLGADLRATIPAGRLRDVRQARHRADRLGGWNAAVAADPAASWDSFVALHRARWTRLGTPDGVLGDPAILAFHAAALPRLAAAGIARLYEMRIAGGLAAAYYTLVQGDRLLFYLSAFDETYARASPGTLLLAHVVEHAIAEGRRELHFLRGGEAYKYAWGAVDRMNAARDLRPNALGLCLSGRMSPHAALARLAMEGRDVAGCVAAARDEVDARWRELARVGSERQEVTAMLREAGRGHTPAASVAEIARLFDGAVRRSPEASVAAYTLGDPGVLHAATDELVAWLRREGLVSARSEIIDLGCGIGRVAAALAPHVRCVRGLDVSEAMVAEARARHPHLRFEATDGQGLAALADASCDLVLAVDCFPYLMQAGVAERHVADAARALRPGGALAILNLSYRGDPAADAADARRWAGAHGLSVTQSGAQPFALWDGTAYVLRRGDQDPATPAEAGMARRCIGDENSKTLAETLGGVRHGCIIAPQLPDR